MAQMLPFPASLPACSPTLPPKIWPSAQSLSPNARLTRVAVSAVPAVGVVLNVTGDKVAMAKLAVAGSMAVRLVLDAERTSAKACLTASSSARHT